MGKVSESSGVPHGTLARMAGSPEGTGAIAGGSSAPAGAAGLPLPSGVPSSFVIEAALPAAPSQSWSRAEVDRAVHVAMARRNLLSPVASPIAKAGLDRFLAGYLHHYFRTAPAALMERLVLQGVDLALSGARFFAAHGLDAQDPLMAELVQGVFSRRAPGILTVVSGEREASTLFFFFLREAYGWRAGDEARQRTLRQLHQPTPRSPIMTQLSREALATHLLFDYRFGEIERVERRAWQIRELYLGLVSWMGEHGLATGEDGGMVVGNILATEALKGLMRNRRLFDAGVVAARAEVVAQLLRFLHVGRVKQARGSELPHWSYDGVEVASHDVLVILKRLEQHIVGTGAIGSGMGGSGSAAPHGSHGGHIPSGGGHLPPQSGGQKAAPSAPQGRSLLLGGPALLGGNLRRKATAGGRAAVPPVGPHLPARIPTPAPPLLMGAGFTIGFLGPAWLFGSAPLSLR